MIWHRCMNCRFVVRALPGMRVSQAMSPALPWDRLRLYWLGSVCPIRCASGSRDIEEAAASTNSTIIFFIRHSGWQYIPALMRRETTRPQETYSMIRFSAEVRHEKAFADD